MKLSKTLFFTTLAAAALAVPPTSGLTRSTSNITCVPGTEGDNACGLKGWNICCTDTKLCVKGDGLKLKRGWSCNGKSIPCDLNKDGDRLCDKEACTTCNERGFCEGRGATEKKRESVDCSQQISCAADLDSHMVCQTHGCGYHYCDAEARVCRKLGDELKRSVFACNDIYCTPGSAGNESCADQKCGYCSAVTSRCTEFPAPAVNFSLPSSPQLGQEVQEKRHSVSCNNIYCTPGEPGDKSCKDQGCGYCNWKTSKCAKFPSEKRQSMACNNIYCTPGPEGDQSCRLQGCGSCSAEASKCM